MKSGSVTVQLKAMEQQLKMTITKTFLSALSCCVVYYAVQGGSHY